MPGCCAPLVVDFRVNVIFLLFLKSGTTVFCFDSVRRLCCVYVCLCWFLLVFGKFLVESIVVYVFLMVVLICFIVFLPANGDYSNMLAVCVVTQAFVGSYVVIVVSIAVNYVIRLLIFFCLSG